MNTIKNDKVMSSSVLETCHTLTLFDHERILVKGRTKKGSSQERSRGGQAGTGRGEDIRQTVTVREGQERAVFGATGRGEVEEVSSVEVVSAVSSPTSFLLPRVVEY